MEFKNCTECGNKYNADHECYECAAKKSESDMQEEYDSTHN